MHNRGVICFANALIQCLFHLPEFRVQVQTTLLQHHMPNLFIIEHFRQLFHKLQMHYDSIINPEDFISAINNIEENSKILFYQCNNKMMLENL